jgi:hypothetical protein
VVTKNAGHLGTLVENFKKGRLKGLSCLLIDDEADQASLNTKAKKATGELSKINDLIIALRAFFEKNTYLQVTATPQALFLQDPKHAFRPKFTELSHPGADYIGGDDFFSDGSTLVQEFPLSDIAILTAGGQPAPSLALPKSLIESLDTFMVAATFKRWAAPEQNCAYLCHVSTSKDDHKHIVSLLQKYKTDLTQSLNLSSTAAVLRLEKAYDALKVTHPALTSVSAAKLIERIGFFAPGIHIKLVNGDTDEDVAVKSPYNLFVGGNKLGRGVTIKNLLVSYYGRNPRRPQADTVLQHARMYGYRRADKGLLRLFLPPQLHSVFKAINKMEHSLRELIARAPSEEFRGIYVEGVVKATRSNVLAPGAVGVYSAGSVYNPAAILRDPSTVGNTAAIDAVVTSIGDKSHAKRSVKDVARILRLVSPDPVHAQHIWNSEAMAASIEQWASLAKQSEAYIWVDRERTLKGPLRETHGILSGGEAPTVPVDRVTLFLLRIKASGGANAGWWPQVRFPGGNYAFAFAV